MIFRHNYNYKMKSFKIIKRLCNSGYRYPNSLKELYYHKYFNAHGFEVSRMLKFCDTILPNISINSNMTGFSIFDKDEGWWWHINPWMVKRV
jgi:hypothetical protein